MTQSLWLGCIWIIIACLIAGLPMRWQYIPGLILLLLAPILITWIGYDYGIWAVIIGLMTLLSLFRRPLYYLARQIFIRILGYF